MARSVRSPLETKRARLELPVSKKPIFKSLGDGVSIGYRRNQSAGTWVMKLSDGKGGASTKALGLADDYADADGGTVLTWGQAQERARLLANQMRADAADSKAAPYATVSEALDAYEENLRIRRGDGRNVSRLRKHIGDALLPRPVSSLTAKELQGWRDRLSKSAAPATVNRTCGAFRAALNLAADHDERIASRVAWGIGLKAIPDAQRSNNVILPDADVRRFVSAAYQRNEAFGLFVETLAVTGSRPSQVARLQVRDLQANRADTRLIMPTSMKGKGEKRIDRRPVPIPPAVAAKLQRVANGRPGTDALLLTVEGREWNDRLYRRSVTVVVEAAGLDPEVVTMYALRHSSIVRQLLANVPIRVVAALHDTSVTMIERTYSKYISDHADGLARAALLDTETARVVPLRDVG